MELTTQVKTKKGKTFTVTYEHSDYFAVNGCRAELTLQEREGKALLITRDRERFLESLGVAWKKSGNPKYVTLQLTDHDFTILSTHCMKVREWLDEKRQKNIDP